MSPLTVAPSLALLLVIAAAGPEQADDEPIEIVVETKKRPDWLFPGLDHPRVQAFFRSGSAVGSSLIGQPSEPEIRPLVRTGTIKIHDPASPGWHGCTDGSEATVGAGGDAQVKLSRSERRAARRFAHALVDSVRPALEACYVNSLDRTPTDATRLVFRVELSRADRGPVLVTQGVLGDAFGNACVHGVLEFAEAKAPQLDASLEIPVWFWLQTVYGPA